jgi:hypothetical protein
LEPYNLGSSEEEATHWLLIDRDTDWMYVGTPEEVRPVLSAQSAEQTPPYVLEEGDEPEEITFEDMRAFLTEAFAEVRPPSSEDIMEQMHRQARLVEELEAWLDNKPLSEGPS